MFSGITQTTIIIQRIDQSKGLLRMQLKKPSQRRFSLGGSILLNGICSTITTVDNATFTVEFMPETRRITTVNQWRVGDGINAEWPVTLRTELSGSIVSGHVDAIGTVQSLQHNQQDVRLTLRYPQANRCYLVPKGSITINGVNLTIMTIAKTTVTVNLIPYTLTHTILNSLQPHDTVNLEYDYITKVIVHHLDQRSYV